MEIIGRRDDRKEQADEADQSDGGYAATNVGSGPGNPPSAGCQQRHRNGEPGEIECQFHKQVND